MLTWRAIADKGTRETPTQMFSSNFCEILNVRILKNIFERLFLTIINIRTTWKRTYVENIFKSEMKNFVNPFYINPHMYKMGPWRPKQYFFGDHFCSKNARTLRCHVFLHFNARKQMTSSFCLRWTEFIRYCEFVPI